MYKGLMVVFLLFVGPGMCGDVSNAEVTGNVELRLCG